MENIKLDEIFRACNVVFGDLYTIDNNFLKKLNLDFLKKTFRQKVFKYHPDTYSGTNPNELKTRQEQYILIVNSYKLLEKFLLSKMHLKIKENILRQQKQQKRIDNFSYHRHRKTFIPNRKLKFAEFLYYNQKITWNELIKAIVWQRQQRDKLGEIALRWKYLDEKEVKFLGRYKKYNELIGEFYVRLNRISPFQLQTLLYQQRKEQPKIGEFFVKIGKLSRYEVDKFAVLLSEYNSKFKKKIKDKPV